MKKLLALFIFLLFSYWSTAQRGQLDQRLDFEADNISLKEALFQLSYQTNIPFSAPSHLLPNKTITLYFKKQSLKKILTTLLEDVPLAYKWNDEQLVFYKKKTPPLMFTISGYIKEKDTGEPLPLATILNTKTGKGTNSNEFGFYSITLPQGETVLQFSYTGHQTIHKKINLRRSTQLDVLLGASVTLQEVLVISREQEGLRPINTNSVFLSAGSIQASPSLGGESDVLRMVGNLSGVNSGTDGFGGIYIRGGSMDENLFLLDGVPIYNPLHAAGLYSIFDDQIIQNVQLYKGNAPARYGGRLSSVIDVKMREGNHHRTTGTIDVGIATAKGNLEGPIQKGKGSYIVSLRQSLFNTYLKPISQASKERKGDTGNSRLSFTDFYTKFNFSLGKKDQLYWSFYSGGDNFNDNNESRISDILTQVTRHNQNLEWGNQAMAFRWNHLFNDKLFVNTTATTSNFRFRSEETYQEEMIRSEQGEIITEEDDLIYGLYNSDINDKAIKIDFSYFPNTKHAFRFGGEIIEHIFRPGALALDQHSAINLTNIAHPDSIASISNTIRSQEYSVYLEDKYSFSEKLQLNVGIRTVLLAVQGNQYWSLQPRLSAQYRLTENLVALADVGKTNQNMHLLTTSSLSLPSDLWVSATEEIPPQSAWQGSIGFIQSLKQGFTLELNIYKKFLDNLIAYEEGANFLTESITLNSTDWESRVTTGSGRSYGVEVTLHKKIGILYGSMNYTWSRATRQFDAINFGESFDFRFDRPHNFNIAATYTLTPRSLVSINWTFQSGLPTTLPTSDFIFYSSNLFTPTTVLNVGQRNGFRLPNNHRLDVECTFYLGKRSKRQVLKAGIYNVYNRQNPIYYRLRDKEDGSGEREFVQVSLLPILPSLSYSYTF